MKATLKEHVLNDVKRKPLIVKLEQRFGLKAQTIRLWSKKQDIRLMAYPIMVCLCEHYECEIQDLIN